MDLAKCRINTSHSSDILCSRAFMLWLLYLKSTYIYIHLTHLIAHMFVNLKLLAHSCSFVGYVGSVRSRFLGAMRVAIDPSSSTYSQTQRYARRWDVILHHTGPKFTQCASCLYNQVNQLPNGCISLGVSKFMIMICSTHLNELWGSCALYPGVASLTVFISSIASDTLCFRWIFSRDNTTVQIQNNC